MRARHLAERRRHRERSLAERRRFRAQPEPERRQDLVVARAAEVDAPPGGPDPLGEAALERGVAVLVGELDAPEAARVLSPELREAVADRLEIGGREEALAVEHRRVGDRRLDVVGDQPFVERMVLAGRVGEHPFVERAPFVPEPAHAAPASLLATSAAKARTRSA